MSNYRLIKRYSFRLDIVFKEEWYELQKQRSFLWFKWWESQGHDSEVGTIVHRGDYGWAERVADYFCIGMPDD